MPASFLLRSLISVPAACPAPCPGRCCVMHPTSALRSFHVRSTYGDMTPPRTHGHTLIVLRCFKNDLNACLWRACFVGCALVRVQRVSEQRQRERDVRLVTRQHHSASDPRCTR